MAMPERVENPVELRCRGGMHGIARGASGILEVKCRHWACTKDNNVTYHDIDLSTGDVIETHTFKDPMKGHKNG